MLGISWYEYLVIAVVALIVIGPKELPAVLRAIGQWTAKIQRMAAEFRGQFQEAMREAEMADLKKEVDNISEQARGFTSQFNDPVNLDGTKWEPSTAEMNKATEISSRTDHIVKPTEDAPPADSSAYGEAGQGTPAATTAQSANAQTTAATPEAAASASVAAPPTSPEASAPKAEEGVHS
jgi:sec-independent protein translocase protein TatB